jgi:hypothetical protein
MLHWAGVELVLEHLPEAWCRPTACARPVTVLFSWRISRPTHQPSCMHTPSLQELSCVPLFLCSTSVCQPTGVATLVAVPPPVGFVHTGCLLSAVDCWHPTRRGGGITLAPHPSTCLFDLKLLPSALTLCASEGRSPWGWSTARTALLHTKMTSLKTGYWTWPNTPEVFNYMEHGEHCVPYCAKPGNFSTTPVCVCVCVSEMCLAAYGSVVFIWGHRHCTVAPSSWSLQMLPSNVSVPYACVCHSICPLPGRRP